MMLSTLLASQSDRISFLSSRFLCDLDRRLAELELDDYLHQGSPLKGFLVFLSYSLQCCSRSFWTLLFTFELTSLQGSSWPFFGLICFVDSKLTCLQTQGFFLGGGILTIYTTPLLVYFGTGLYQLTLMTELGLELCIFCTTICCLLIAGLINLTFLTCYIFLIQLPSLFCKLAELMDWMGINTSFVIVKGEIFDGFMQLLRVIFYGTRVYNLYWLRTELITLQFCGGIYCGITFGGETTRCSFAQLQI